MIGSVSLSGRHHNMWGVWAAHKLAALFNLDRGNDSSAERIETSRQSRCYTTLGTDPGQRGVVMAGAAGARAGDDHGWAARVGGGLDRWWGGVVKESARKGGWPPPAQDPTLSILGVGATQFLGCRTNVNQVVEVLSDTAGWACWAWFSAVGQLVKGVVGRVSTLIEKGEPPSELPSEPPSELSAALVSTNVCSGFLVSDNDKRATYRATCRATYRAFLLLRTVTRTVARRFPRWERGGSRRFGWVCW